MNNTELYLDHLLMDLQAANYESFRVRTSMFVDAVVKAYKEQKIDFETYTKYFSETLI